MKRIAVVCSCISSLVVLLASVPEVAADSAVESTGEVRESVTSPIEPRSKDTQPQVFVGDGVSPNVGRGYRLVGAGVMFAGVATTGLGLWMASQAHEPDRMTEEIERAPYYVLAAGAVTVLAGGLLFKIGIDKRSEALSDRYAIPVLSSNQIGVAFGGSF